MAEDSVTVFGQFVNKDDKQLMYIFEKKEAEVAKLMDNVFRTAGNEGAEFDLIYGSLKKVENFVTNMYRSYLIYCKKTGKKPVLSVALKDFKVTCIEDEAFSAASYFGAVRRMDTEVRNAYILSSEKVALYHIKAATKMHYQIFGKCEGLLEEIQNGMKFVADTEGENLFTIFMRLLEMAENDKKQMKILMEQTLRIIDFAKDIKNELRKEGINITCNADACKKIYDSFVNTHAQAIDDDREEEKVQENVANTEFEQPVNILNKLLKFSETSDEFKVEFRKNLDAFKSMSDKKGSDDNSRIIRKNLTANFYELYEKVFLKSMKEKVHGVVLDMFFNYGIVDETMFSAEMIEHIRLLKHTQKVENAHVYTVKQWLEAIYSGEKEPSRNDFDMDYSAHVLDMERRGDISSEQRENYLNNTDLKVDYEINNFIRMNSRLTNGELSVFCPVLTEEEFTAMPDQMFVKDENVTNAIKWLLTVDYSVFHREQMYDNRENGITNMLINVQVFPDIILMPVTGVHSRMWQEIDGKKRDTPGRFTLPAFTQQDVNDLIIQAAGSFRWQLCKKIQGNYWNNISEKSLTSEYYDYIQFYKKNRELSDQAKEKIGSQLQRARNNFAECFAMDYVIWVKNEVTGSMRLNKLVREIMATYCPPSKSFRENLKNQPLFASAFARYERNKVKKVKEINNRRAAIRNANGEETPEFIEEAKFWEEM